MVVSGIEGSSSIHVFDMYILKTVLWSQRIGGPEGVCSNKIHNLAMIHSFTSIRRVKFKALSYGQKWLNYLLKNMLADFAGCTKSLRRLSFANSGLGDTRFQILVRSKSMCVIFGCPAWSACSAEGIGFNLCKQDALQVLVPFWYYKWIRTKSDAGKKYARMCPSTHFELIRMWANRSQCAVYCQHCQG